MLVVVRGSSTVGMVCKDVFLDKESYVTDVNGVLIAAFEVAAFCTESNT